MFDYNISIVILIGGAFMIDLNDGKAIFDKVERLTIERGWSLYELAKRTGLSSTAFYSWRDSKSIPTLPRLEAICDAFGISILELLSEGDDLIYLTEEQKELLNEIGTLTDKQRQAVINLIKSFKDNS